MSEAPAAPLRPLGVAEILDGAVRLVQRNARAALAVALPFAVARTVLSAVVSYAALSAGDAATLAAIVSLLVSILVNTVLAGLLAPLFGSDLLGTRISAGAALRQVGGRAWALAGLAVVATVAEGAGLFALVAGGVWLWGAWAVAAPALVLERTSLVGALGRSVALVRGSFWRTWGIRALGWLLTSALSFLISLPFQAIASYVVGYDPLRSSQTVGNAGLYVTLLSIGSVVAATVLPPISAAIDVLLYADLRMRKEGMDIVLTLPQQPDAPVSGRPVASAW
jgi:hypothetical protein